MNLPDPELDTLCAAAQEYGASDLLLHEDRRPKLRLDGRLVELDHPPLPARFFDTLWSFCGAKAEETDCDASLTSSAGIRFRANLLRQLGKRAAVLRRIRSDIPELGTLGVPAALLQEWCSRTSGIVLVCGPAGSGKSTTLAAVLQWINRAFSRHVVTIEDPVEYLFENEQSTFTQREVGIDTPSFAEGLRRALRQNPDVILVGEIRDPLTATTAIQASETGHLVLATLHASSSSDAIARLQLLFPPEERDGVRRTLASQLLGIIWQRLLPAAQGGLVLAAEYFSNVGATRKYVAEGMLPELADFISRSDAPGARDYLSSLVALVRSGTVTEEVAIASTDDQQELQRALRGISSLSKTKRV